MSSGNIKKELIKLNLGCGLNAPSGWINIDASFTASLSRWRGLYNGVCKIARVKPVAWPKNIRVLDVKKGLPFSDGTVNTIFSSHMLEHMGFADASFVVKECYRCLCTGGVIRIIVPDLYQIARKYLDLVTADPKEEHSKKFLQDLNMQEGTHRGIWKLFGKIFGHSRHSYMYDQWSLRDLLEKYGFSQIEKKSYS